jgi:acyl-CoA thioesterase-1
MSNAKTSDVDDNVQQAAAVRNARNNLRVKIFLLAFATLASSMFVANSFAQEENTVVVLGDSNASGYGVGPQEAYPAKLAKNLRSRGRPVGVINAGFAGDTFGAMLDRIDFSVPLGTRLVVVQGGYNDLANGVPPEQTTANLNGILSRLQARGIKTVVCGFFDKNWDAIGRKLAAAHRATFVPGSTCYDPKHVGPDGLHMSATGHEVVAKRLAGVLQPSTVLHKRVYAPSGKNSRTHSENYH